MEKICYFEKVYQNSPMFDSFIIHEVIVNLKISGLLF